MNLLLLLPATWFWSSVVMRVTLGTDYFFDVLFDQISQYVLGNAILVMIVVFLPGLAVGFNGMSYMTSHGKKRLVLAVFSALLLALGFFAAVRRV